METLHFISGLPRSGSTLLAAILRQNPRITSGMASPVAPLYMALEGTMAANRESSVFISDASRRNVLRGVFENYYSDANRDIILDNNRAWLTKLPALSILFPSAKVIATVRDFAWILDSFERLHCRNPFEPSGISGFRPGGTVFSRSAALSNGDGAVGWSLNALREALAGEHRDIIKLVEYEDLCKDPDGTIASVYDFLRLPRYAGHDFDNVQYSASEFDRNLGARGLHDVKGKVEWRTRETILPKPIFDGCKDDQFWRVKCEHKQARWQTAWHAMHQDKICDDCGAVLETSYQDESEFG